MSSALMSFFQFVAELIPQLIRLFQKHGGQSAPAKRDMESLIGGIRADENEIDRELERQNVSKR